MTWADGQLASLLKAAASTVGYASCASDQATRAILVPSAARMQLESKPLRQRVRDLDRRARRLGERGEVGWRSHGHEGVPAQVVDRFLALENMGWKGRAGSSLRSSAQGEAFFREMAAGFAAERRALFAELTLDGAAIAVTCNLISGNVGFAFKIGWDTEYHTYSPGWLNELETMRQADALLGDLAYIDSGAAPDSYIDRLWLDRRPLVTLSIPLTLAGRLALDGVNSARSLKRRCASVIGWVRDSSAHMEQRPT